jgi:hypothetical protein
MRRFSSGIRHRELMSLALIFGTVCDVPPLTRDNKRSFPLLMKWFDENNQVINAEREAIEREKSSNPRE